MVKRGSTTFSVTKVAKAGLVASATLQKIMDLEKEVSKLRHHVSVLSKRNHVLQKEAGKGKRVEEADSEVASPGRGKEPELQLVAEPSDEKVAEWIVAGEKAEVRVAPVAKPAVAESRVALEVDEPEVAMVRLPKGKKRRLTVGGEEAESGDETEVMTVIPVEEEEEVIVAPVGPRLDLGGRQGVVPVGPRRFMPVRPDSYQVARQEYRFVHRSLIERRNGMVGDTYQTRGNFARAQFGNQGGGFVGRGSRPYR